MRRDKVIYWTATGLVSAGMLMSAFMYLTRNAQLMQSFKYAGYPEYFVTLLGIAKLLGAVALVVPIWSKLKEWAYAGFAFTFIGAIWTHVATSTPWMAPLIALVLLTVSYWYHGRVKAA
ncbi:MAG TPA: DoxX family protein [Cyclobacteriaceae bacterium]|nr:DoxX family protein [Cyclobacteriaceae bacterium]